MSATTTAELLDLAPSVTPCFEAHSIYDLSVDGERYLASAPGAVELREVTTGKLLASFAMPRGSFDAKISPDGERVAVWGFEHFVSVFDLASGEQRARLDNLRTQFGRLFWTRDSSRLAVIQPWFHGAEPVVVLDRDGQRQPDVARPHEGRCIAAAGPRSLVFADGNPGLLWFGDLATRELTPTQSFVSSSYVCAASAGRFALGWHPTHVALGALPSAPELPLHQETVDSGAELRLMPQLAALEERRARARSRLDQVALDDALRATREALQNPPLPQQGVVQWATGAGGGQPNRDGLTGMAFLDERTLLVSGVQDIVRASLSERVEEEVLARAQPRHGRKVILKLVAAAGNTAAVRVYSPLGAFPERVLFLRIGPAGHGLLPFNAVAPTRKSASSRSAKR